MEEKTKIISIAKEIKPSDGNNFIEIYTPSSEGSIQYDGYFVDFLASIDISSMPDLPPRQPGDALETRDQLEWRYYMEVRSHPVKYLGIYFSNPGSTTRHLRLRFPVWAVAHGYTEGLMMRFTQYGTGVLAYGAKLWARMEPSREGMFGTGPLSGSDIITLHIAGVESATVDDDSSEQAWVITGANPSSATVTTSSSVVLATNPARKIATIINRGNAIAYLNYGSFSTAGAGIGLNPGGSTHVLNVREVNYTGPISAVTSSGSTTLEIMEGV
jgi:hypothetical protein